MDNLRRIFGFFIIYFTLISGFYILYKNAQYYLIILFFILIMTLLISILLETKITIKNKIKSNFLVLTINFLFLSYLLYFIFNSAYLLNLISINFWFTPLLASLSFIMIFLLLYLVKKYKLNHQKIILFRNKYLGFWVEKKVKNEYFEFRLIPFINKSFRINEYITYYTYFLPSISTEVEELSTFLAESYGLQYGFQVTGLDNIKKLHTFFKQAREYNLDGYFVDIYDNNISFITPVNNINIIQKSLNQIVLNLWSLNEYRDKNSTKIKTLDDAIKRMSVSESFKERINSYKTAINNLKENFDKINNLEKTYSCLIRDYLIELSISKHELSNDVKLLELDSHYHEALEEYKLLQDSIKVYSDLI